MTKDTNPTNPKGNDGAQEKPDTTVGQAQSSAPPLQDQLSAAKLPKETREFMRSRMVAANFGNIVTVLMQSPGHKERKLSDLRDIVLPALINNQFRVAEAHKRGSGHTIPVGIILWARVSDEVDQRLSDVEQVDVNLSADDWVSGEQLWIMEIVGEQRFIASMLKDLQQKDFKGKTVKYRQQTENGIKVSSLDVQA